MAGKLYSLESVTYLTAGPVCSLYFQWSFYSFLLGLEDASQQPDIEVENFEIKMSDEYGILFRLKVL